MDLKGLSKFFNKGRRVSGNLHTQTIGEVNTDEIGEWSLPRLGAWGATTATIQDYTGSFSTFGKFYLDDDCSSIAGYQPAEVVPGLPFVRYDAAKGPSGSHIILTLTALPLLLQNTSSNLWFTIPLLTFPFGRQTILGGSCSLSIDFNYATYLQTSGTAVNVATAAGNIAAGSAPATSTTLTSTIVDFIASTALGTVAAGKNPAKTFMVGPTAFDWSTKALSTTAKNFNLSGSVTTGGSASSLQIVPVTGTITLDIAYHGDFTAT